ncbi:extracellular solute-binding protein [Actinomyces sp. MRS3W]|uniref:extracellular solute-binding protein n=1 Tax=Actinomyces sp. MRS3W TaxID=2800796 RepID=UPI0028FD0EE1|nr:extracellular solute-binding protein [Actinomyces sp. MRS3W]MDU0349433.1 extracellular solute-binding protein [Actinomyces sp. MRS3W]
MTRRTALTGAAAASAALALAACTSDQSTPETTSGVTTLTIMTNAISGGKNAAEADWIANWVIPEFTAAQEEAGRQVEVVFEAQGVDDEDYKTKAALDFQSGKGADVVGLDGIWIGEFAQAGYIKPLQEVAGDAVDSWDGWEQISEAVQQAASFESQRYGVPQGADGRVIYYNRDIFAQAGLPTDWQPTSWEEILQTARTLKQQVDGVVPLQLNAGTAMGEATTMQGFLPMLVGTGQTIWSDGLWAADTAGMRDVLDLYRTIYVDEELGDPILQQEASGRDTSFQEFAAGRIAILFEGDYFWRSVINPDEEVGTAPMADRDTVVGYAKIPAMKPGAGVNGQDFVSMSGGTARVLNPNSANPALAWELLAFMNSPEAFAARAAGTLSISPREDVNAELLASDAMLSFVSEEVLPITSYRPGLAEYPEVSVLLQQATLDVVTGTSVDDAVAAYVTALEGVVGHDAISDGD